MKIRGTKKQKAAELFLRLENGPSYSFDTFGNLDLRIDNQLTDQQRLDVQKYFEYHTRLWLRSWITPACEDLIPKPYLPPKDVV